MNVFGAGPAAFALALSVAMAPQYPQNEFKRMQLRADGADLIPAWPWEEGAERGRYARRESHE